MLIPDEIRSYKIPAQQLVDILEAILALLGEYDASWSTMKKFLAKRSALDSIASLDPRKVSLKALKRVKKLLKSRPMSFNRKRISQISKAAGPFCDFIHASVSLVETCQKIKPLERELNDVDNKLSEARWEQGKNRQLLEGLKAKKKNVEREYLDSKNDMISLEGKIGIQKFDFMLKDRDMRSRFDI